MLLTSGQISVAISSTVVFIFTSLLFLSGYVLQQQTLHSLQKAIRPHIPTPSPTTNPVLAKHFGRPPGHSFYDKYLARNRPKGGWAKVAYVQLVREHVDVCSAVMGMRELEVDESMAQRIIMYPKEWDETAQSGQRRNNNPHVETTKRLLRKAAREYKVMLQPIDPTPHAEAQASLSQEEKYPLTNLISLIHYDRILFLQPTGLILDPTPLDLLFTLPMSTPLLGLSSPEDPSRVPSILLFEPSKKTYAEIITTLPEGVYPDTEFLQKVPVEPAPDDPENDVHLLAKTSLLESESAAFNATQFLEMTAYVQIQDAGLPGPEYVSSRREFESAMPVGKEARMAWEKVYERFGERRMEVCGLDLEAVESREGDGEMGKDTVEELR